MKKYLILLSFLFGIASVSNARIVNLTDNSKATIGALSAEISTRTLQGQMRYSGGKSSVTITVISSDTVVVCSGTFVAYQAPVPQDGTAMFMCSSATFTLTNNLQAYYIVADYNEGGTPLYRLTTNVNEINTFTIIAVYTLVRIDDDIDYIYWGESGNATAEKAIDKDVRTQRFEKESTGMVLTISSEPFANCPQVTGGYVWHGTVRQLYDAYDASVSSVQMLVRTSGVWKERNNVSYYNTNYDDGDLKVLATGLYGIAYFYRCMAQDSDLYCVLSSTGYLTQAEAIEAQAPSALPVRVTVLGLYIGRAIFVAGSSVPYVESAFNLTQSGTGGSNVIAHNNTTGIDGGGPGDYQHLTTAQVAIVDNVDNNYLAKSSGTETTRLFNVNRSSFMEVERVFEIFRSSQNINDTNVASKLSITVHDSSMAAIVVNMDNKLTLSSGTNMDIAIRALTDNLRVSTDTLIGIDNTRLNISSGIETERLFKLNLASFTINDGNVASKISNSSATATYQNKLDFTASTSTYKDVFAPIPVLVSSIGVNVTAYNQTTNIAISTIVITQIGGRNSSVLAEVDINTNKAATVTIDLYRDTTLLRTITINTAVGTGLMNYPLLWFSNTNSSTAGVLTYTIRIRSDSTSATQQVVGYAWRVIEQ